MCVSERVRRRDVGREGKRERARRHKEIETARQRERLEISVVLNGTIEAKITL